MLANPLVACLRKSKDILFSKKKIDSNSVDQTQLSRVLTLVDLCFLGKFNLNDKIKILSIKIF